MALGIVHGSSGGESISFLDAPRATPGSIRLEPKTCESCGSGFFRPVQRAKAHGARDCQRCLDLMKKGLPVPCALTSSVGPRWQRG